MAVMVAGAGLLRGVQAATGDLDATFDIDGMATTDFFGDIDFANDVKVQSVGKIIAAGRIVTPDGFGDFGLARYNSDGTPDGSFGVGGKVNTDFFGFSDACFAIAVQTDGKIVAAGGAFPDPGINSNDFAMTRYNSDGSIDGTFGVGGKVSVDFGGGMNDEALDVTLHSDGKILVVIGAAEGVNSDFTLARYNGDGTLDIGFGSGGSVTTDFFGDDDGPSSVVAQSDGKIIVAGYATNSMGDDDFALARYNSDGSPDGTFGIGGKVTTDFAGGFDVATSLALQDDGKIIAAGRAGDDALDFGDFGLVRYNSDGSPDAGFGIGGNVTTDFSGVDDSASAVMLQCDGKIVAAGTADEFGAADAGLARYNTDGSIDAGFGNAGKVITDFLGGYDLVTGAALQGDGRIVVTGTVNHSDFIVARYDNELCVIAPCPKSQGHWKNNPSIWPVDALELGSQSYSKAELRALLKTSTQTDASLILARQLIAAKLNIENGADPTPVAQIIAHADSLLAGFSGKLPYKVKSSSATGQAMTADATLLNNYNNALLTPGCTP
jgi:uncharacterized delta-60 repeat protein